MRVDFSSTDTHVVLDWFRCLKFDVQGHIRLVVMRVWKETVRWERSVSSIIIKVRKVYHPICSHLFGNLNSCRRNHKVSRFATRENAFRNVILTFWVRDQHPKRSVCGQLACVAPPKAWPKYWLRDWNREPHGSSCSWGSNFCPNLLCCRMRLVWLLVR